MGSSPASLYLHCFYIKRRTPTRKANEQEQRTASKSTADRLNEAISALRDQSNTWPRHNSCYGCMMTLTGI